MHQIPYFCSRRILLFWASSEILAHRWYRSASFVFCLLEDSAHDKFTASDNSHITRWMLDLKKRRKIFSETFRRAHENKNVQRDFPRHERNFLQIPRCPIRCRRRVETKVSSSLLWKSVNTFKHPSDNAICVSASRFSFVFGSRARKRSLAHKRSEQPKYLRFDAIAHINHFPRIYIANVFGMATTIKSSAIFFREFSFFSIALLCKEIVADSSKVEWSFVFCWRDICSREER